MPSYERIGEQFTLEDDAELEWQVHVEHWDIERRCVGDGVDGVWERIEIIDATDDIEACNFHGRQDRLHDEPRPEAGEIVLDSAVAVEERADQRDRAENIV